jgi:hypothetical protein
MGDRYRKKADNPPQARSLRSAGETPTLFGPRLSVLREDIMKRLAVALAVMLSLAAGRPALADEPIVIKFSHVVAPDAPKGKAALFFKELAENTPTAG